MLRGLFWGIGWQMVAVGVGCIWGCGWVVSAEFEVKGLRNGAGQVFGAGVLTAGNAFAPVDSFLGLQYAAQRSVDVMIREGAPGLRPLKGAGVGAAVVALGEWRGAGLVTVRKLDAI